MSAHDRGSDGSPLTAHNENDYRLLMMEVNLKPAVPTRSRPASAGTMPRRLDSRELFRGGREVRIDHQGVEYRLRRTRHEKLILTK